MTTEGITVLTYFLIGLGVLILLISYVNRKQYDVMVADDWVIGHKYFSDYEEAKSHALKMSKKWEYCMLQDMKGKVLNNYCSGKYKQTEET